jgi:hypothetical protein
MNHELRIGLINGFKVLADILPQHCGLLVEIVVSVSVSSLLRTSGREVWVIGTTVKLLDEFSERNFMQVQPELAVSGRPLMAFCCYSCA